MKAWGKTGAFWGGLWGILFGAAFFVVPGIGPMVIAGPLVAAVVGGLEGAAVVGGLSAIGAGLASIGIPKDSVVRYEERLSVGEYLVLFNGAPDEVDRAAAVLRKDDKHTTVDIHDNAS